MRQSSYRFLDTTLAITGPADVLDAVHRRLRYFAATAGAPDIRFVFTAVGDVAAHTVSRPAGASRQLRADNAGRFDIEYFPADDSLYVAGGDSVRALCDGADGTVEVSILDADPASLWTATHPTFVIALFELLKRRGYFNLHAAGLSMRGKALLLAGHSTAGKSTLAVALCRAGFEFLSDDYVFVTRRTEGLRVIGFAEDLDLCDETLTMFPELRVDAGKSRRRGWTKSPLRVEDHWGMPRFDACTPAVVVFPTVSNRPSSTIRLMDEQQAAAELASNIQLTLPALAQEHMNLIGELIRTCACFRLETGRDFDDLPNRLGELLDAAAPD